MPDGRIARSVALLGPRSAVFFTSLLLLRGFDPAATGDGVRRVRPLDAVPRHQLPRRHRRHRALLVLLTTFLTPLVLSRRGTTSTKRGSALSVFFMLVLETGMLGAFLALDLFLFYVFWELMLVPMYFIIGIWGGPRRIYAAIKFFLYTMVGSLLMLVAILVLVLAAPEHLGVAELRTRTPPTAAPACSTRDSRPWQACGGRRSSGCSPPSPWPSPSRCRCSRSTPGCPTRTSRRRPRARSILAGVLLKMGTYGFLRFALPLFPAAAAALRRR